MGQFASAPAGTEGALYFNTTESTTKLYSNSAWADLGGGWDGIIPNYTTTQRNALSLVDGLIVYNTTENAVQIYASDVWRNVGAKLSGGIVCSLDGDCDSTHCIDGVCCATTCDGNCNRCNVAGSEGTCTDTNLDCTGNCDVCSAGNCAASVSLCTGNCDQCTGSGTSYSCSANVALCTGNCDQCTGSGTVYNCAADVALCTGNCDICSGSGTVYNCAASASLCTGNCDICSGSETTYNCTASNALCSNTTASCTCSGSGTVFDCQACAACKVCSGYSCSVGQTTNWGQNLYSCTGNNTRCYAGVCKTCSSPGYLSGAYNDTENYFGGICTGGPYGDSCCWRVGSAGTSCNAICSSYGGCLPGNWDGYAQHYMCDEKCCKTGIESYWPGCKNDSGYVWGFKRENGPAYPQDCAAYAAGVTRVCICQY